MSIGTRIVLNDDANAPYIKQVKDYLRLYNWETNPAFMAALENAANEPKPLLVFALGPEDHVLGGLIGETQLAWFKVHILAVESESRSSGIGSRLLRTGEGEAVNRGCRHVYLDAMEYHTTQFYEGHGYERVGTVPDWDSRGRSRYIYTKDLAR
ncbi:MAG: GNAT family N-acetyltransferase [Pseudomonadales bacterium]